jgi:hypothetical protein
MASSSMLTPSLVFHSDCAKIAIFLWYSLVLYEKVYLVPGFTPASASSFFASSTFFAMGHFAQSYSTMSAPCRPLTIRP